MGLPSLEIIHKFIVGLNLLDNNSVKCIDTHRVITKLSSKANYTKLFSQWSNYINDFQTHKLKWSPQLNCSEEPPITSIWIAFSQLHLHYFNQSTLYSLRFMFSKPIHVDNATAWLSRPFVTKILVQLDVTSRLKKRSGPAPRLVDDNK